MSRKNKKWKVFKGIFSNNSNTNGNTRENKKIESEVDVEEEEFVITESTDGVVEIKESTKDVFVIDPDATEYQVIYEPYEDNVNNSHTSNDKTEPVTPVHDAPESKTDIFVIEPTQKDYQILEIDEDFTDDEVKRQYRTLAKKYHPDNGGDPKKFMRLRKAYDKVMKYRAS